MSLFVPTTLPKASRELVIEKATAGWLADGNEGPLPKVFFFMVRGYRKTSMGDPTRNDVGINDDAGFLVTPDAFYPENMNTDPSRLGWNPGVGKPYGMLQPGVWWFYPGPHKGHRPSFRQADDADVAKRLGIPHEGKFKVMRMWGYNDPRNYLEWGHQQVNIHRQVISSTSSWLCLTVPFDRSDRWLQIATDALQVHGQKIIPVILVEGPIN